MIKIIFCVWIQSLQLSLMRSFLFIRTKPTKRFIFQHDQFQQAARFAASRWPSHRWRTPPRCHEGSWWKSPEGRYSRYKQTTSTAWHGRADGCKKTANLVPPSRPHSFCVPPTEVIENPNNKLPFSSSQLGPSGQTQRCPPISLGD